MCHTGALSVNLNLNRKRVGIFLVTRVPIVLSFICSLVVTKRKSLFYVEALVKKPKKLVYQPVLSPAPSTVCLN